MGFPKRPIVTFLDHSHLKQSCHDQLYSSKQKSCRGNELYYRKLAERHLDCVSFHQIPVTDVELTSVLAFKPTIDLPPSCVISKESILSHVVTKASDLSNTAISPETTRVIFVLALGTTAGHGSSTRRSVTTA